MLNHASRAICAVLAFAKVHKDLGFKNVDVLMECEDRDEDVIVDIQDTSDPFKCCAVSFSIEDGKDWYVFEMRDGQLITYECEYLNDNEAWPKYLEVFAANLLASN